MCSFNFRKELKPCSRAIIICRHSGKPIRLSPTFVNGELKIAIAPTLDPALYSRVLPARCRHCHREAIYAVDQIIDL